MLQLLSTIIIICMIILTVYIINNGKLLNEKFMGCPYGCECRRCGRNLGKCPYNNGED